MKLMGASSLTPRGKRRQIPRVARNGGYFSTHGVIIDTSGYLECIRRCAKQQLP